MKESIESIKGRLKETGFKITPQRRAILEILLENDDKHLSSEEIYDMVRVSCPEIGLATVYINLMFQTMILSFSEYVKIVKKYKSWTGLIFFENKI